MGMDRALRTAARGLIAALIVVCLAVLARKVFRIYEPLVVAVGAAGAMALLWVLIHGARQWPSETFAAAEIDDRLRLDERISSAMAVAASDKPMARAVVDDGLSYARAVRVPTAFPLRFHREFIVVIGIAVIALAMTQLPEFDVLARETQIKKEKEEREAVAAEARKMKRELAQIRKRVPVAATERLAEQFKTIEDTITKMEKGKLTKAEAMAKLSDMSEAMQSAIKDMQAKTSPGDNQLMSKQPLTMADRLADALQAKDFKAAASELESLAQKAAAGELSPDELKKLAQELDTLSKSLANIPGLSESLKECAACMSKGEMGKLGKSAKAGAFKLGEMADTQAQIEALAAAAGMCKGGQCKLGGRVAPSDLAGVFTPGDKRHFGTGMGGPGMGAGGKAPIKPHAVTLQPDKIDGEMKPGRAVQMYFEDGVQIRGDAKADYVEAVAAAQADAAQALEQNEIPRAYESYVRDYFDSMRNK